MSLQDSTRPHLAHYNSVTSSLKNGGTRPACLQSTESPNENVWRIINHNTQQRRTQTVEQLKLIMKQEWEGPSNSKLPCINKNNKVDQLE